MVLDAASENRSCSYFIIIPLVLVIAISARLVSFQWSPLPYNVDGLSELRIIEDIVSTGHFDFDAAVSLGDSYVSDMPLLAVFTAFLSSTLGASPVSSTQLSSSIIGSIAILCFSLIFLQHLQNSRRAVLASSLVLTLAGSFAFSTGCTWKEVLAFLMIALALYSYPIRQNTQHRVLLTLTLLLLVFTHHHSTVVAYVIFTFAIVIDVSSRRNLLPLTKRDKMDVITAVSAWSLAAGYYTHISLPYLDYLSPQTDLYLYLAVAFMTVFLGVALSRREGRISRLPLGMLVPAAGVVLLVYNYFDPLFEGTSAPSSAIFLPMAAYIVLLGPAIIGSQVAFAKTGPRKNLILALILGPLSLIIFAFMRSLDATSYTIIYRTFDFLMPGFAILIGLGFAVIVKDMKRLGAVAGVFIVVVASSTLPIAYQTQELFGVQNHTFWFEYDAFEWLSEHGVDSYDSDQRLGQTGWRLFDIPYDRMLPYSLKEGLPLNTSSFFVLEEQWTTNGAQEFPFGVVVVDEDTVRGTLNSNSVIYVGGPQENNLYCFLTGD